MWEFAVGLFMIHIWKHSLLLASLYGLVEMTAIVFFGVTIGDWMDKFPRLKVQPEKLCPKFLNDSEPCWITVFVVYNDSESRWIAGYTNILGIAKHIHL